MQYQPAGRRSKTQKSVPKHARAWDRLATLDVGGVVSDTLGMRLRIEQCHGVTWDDDTLGQYVFLAVSHRCAGFCVRYSACEDWTRREGFAIVT